jgi:hypothetical protein
MEERNLHLDHLQLLITHPPKTPHEQIVQYNVVDPEFEVMDPDPAPDRTELKPHQDHQNWKFDDYGIKNAFYHFLLKVCFKKP